MLNIWQFKNENYGDDWQDFTTRYDLDFWAGEIAKQIAEENYLKDPVDPDNFTFPVTLKGPSGNTFKFIVTTKVVVSYRTLEVKE